MIDKLIYSFFACAIAAVLVFLGFGGIAFKNERDARVQLDQTIQVACKFLKDDTQTRTQQVTNSVTQYNAELAYLKDIKGVIRLFSMPARKGAKPLTKLQKANISILRSYFLDEQKLWRANAKALRKNITLTKELITRLKDEISLTKRLSC